MRVAIVSDINANRQAWDSILADTQLNGIDSFLCLGDIVGAGPAPREVLESVHARATWILAGERDRAVAGSHNLDCFDEPARAAIQWTRSQLSRDARRFLRDLPLVMEGPGFACAHAEFEQPNRFDYLSNAATVWGSLDAAPKPLLFVGHTRLPGVHELRPNGSLKHHGLVDFVPRSGCRYLVDVGSVADPRDGNPRASYCVFDTDTYHIQFRRVAFDVDSWAAEIAAAKLAISPYLVNLLKFGQQAGNTPPPDFVPGEACGDLPPILDFDQPIAPNAINFDPAAEPAQTAKSASTTRRRKRRPSTTSTRALAKSAKAGATAPDLADSPKKKNKTVILGVVAAVLVLGGLIAALSGDDEPPPPPPPPKVVAEKPAPKPAPKPKPEPKTEPKPEPKPEPSNKPVAPEDGLLHARHATIHGDQAKYESQEDRMCIGFWNNISNWVSWKVRLKAGRYSVGVVQARPGKADHVYEITVADQVLVGKVEQTGSWGNFVTVTIGEVIIDKSGVVEVACRPTKGGKSFMNLRGIQLTPKR
jgi:predicted phosphodiesterase